MSRKNRWSARSLRRLEALADYIAKDNLLAAERTLARIRAAAELLENYTAAGRVGRFAGTRELVMTGLPCILPYRVTETTVEIITVMHTSQKWPEKF